MTFLVALLLSAAPAFCQVPAPAAVQRRPNIIFILADDLGYGDLGCYGQTLIKTPNLDKMAAEGMRFTDYYAGSTVCAPSRCTLMTGFHTGHGWIRGNSKQALRPQDTTVATVLRESGYYTGCVGKWGLGGEGTAGLPELQGFIDYAGYLDQVHAHDYYTTRIWHHDARAPFHGWQELPENYEDKQGLYLPDLFARAAQNFVRVNKPDPLNGMRPFFLYLALITPHANNEEGKRTGNGMQVPTDAPYSKESWPQVEKNKAAMITRMDDDIGKLFAKLKSEKVDSNTIVFFTSDNGPHKEGGVDPKFFKSAGPFRGTKRDLYEGGIREPMIVRWPGQIPAGVVNHQVWASWDILPTLAEIARAKYPTNTDGISMLPTLLGKTQTNQHDVLYWEFHEGGFSQAVRLGDWKIVRPQLAAPAELYNLKTDPGEQKNVAPDHADVMAKADAAFKASRTDSTEWPIKPPPKPAEKKQ